LETGIRLTNEEIAILSDEYDRNHDGTIFYRDFVTRLDQEIRNATVFDKVFAELLAHTKLKKLDISEEIKQVDPQNTMKLTKQDLNTFLTRIEFRPVPQELTVFMA
jgi:hypothetical protein